MKDENKKIWPIPPAIICITVGLFFSLLLEPRYTCLKFPLLTIGFILSVLLFIVRFIIARIRKETNKDYFIYLSAIILYPFIYLLGIIALSLVQELQRK